MDQLDERTLRDLARLRDREAPSAAAKQRMFAALELQLGGGPDGGDGGSLGDGGATSGFAWAAKVIGATAGLTVGGLVAIRAGVEVVRALSGAPEPHDRSAEHVVIATTTVERDEPEAAPPEVITDEVELEAAPPIARPNAPAIATAKNKPTPADTLAAELALLEAAHAAADPAASLIELERHLARFPRGELADERELLRIEALCRLDRLADARALAERFVAEHPNSALRRRISSACPALGE